MKRFYGFLEVRDGLKQVYFDEVVIEARDYREAKRAFAHWLVLKTLDGVPDGEDRESLMAIELATGVMGFRKTHLLKVPCRKASELISEARFKLQEVRA